MPPEAPVALASGSWSLRPLEPRPPMPLSGDGMPNGWCQVPSSCSAQKLPPPTLEKRGVLSPSIGTPAPLPGRRRDALEPPPNEPGRGELLQCPSAPVPPSPSLAPASTKPGSLLGDALRLLKLPSSASTSRKEPGPKLAGGPRGAGQSMPGSTSEYDNESESMPKAGARGCCGCSKKDSLQKLGDSPAEKPSCKWHCDSTAEIRDSSGAMLSWKKELPRLPGGGAGGGCCGACGIAAVVLGQPNSAPPAARGGVEDGACC